MPDAPQIDLFDPSFSANPYPLYARLRAEAPVLRINLPSGEPVWLVTRFDDVETVFTDKRFVKDWRNAMTAEQSAQFPQETEALKMFSRDMLHQDPPNHTRLRTLVSKAFTPKLIRALEPRIQEITDSLIAGMKGKSEVDLIDAFAFPLPIVVIAELLGVPTEDRDKFREWSDSVMGLQSLADADAIASKMREFEAYLRNIFDARRADSREDLISGLLAAEEAGDKLNEQELFSMVFVLIIAGHETTVNLIGNGTLALLQHPDQLEKLKADPTLIRAAIEEMVRFNGPVEVATQRYASEDIELNGATIPRGERVMAIIASANHDERHFEASDTLDIGRELQPHLAFGHGIHFCLGASLARLEAQTAIRTLLETFPNLQLATDAESLTWRPGMIIRGVVELPVRLA